MNTQQIFIELLKTVHNEYMEVIYDLEDTLQKGYEQKMVPIFGDPAVEESVMHSTVDLICLQLKRHCDDRIEQIRKDINNAAL